MLPADAAISQQTARRPSTRVAGGNFERVEQGCVGLVRELAVAMDFGRGRLYVDGLSDGARVDYEDRDGDVLVAWSP